MPTGVAILTIGDELVSGDRLDTNSAWLSRQLLEIGLCPAYHLALPDDRSTIAAALREAADRVDLILVTGGLGPTEDDLTRHALADALGEELVTDHAALKAMRERFFESRGMEMPPGNVVQARRPNSARMIPNALGTAPGLMATVQESRVYVFPGVPVEMEEMWRAHVRQAIVDWLSGRVPTHGVRTIWVHSVSMPESRVGEALADLMRRDASPTVGTLVRDSIVSVRIRAEGPHVEISTLAERAARTVEQRLGVYAFGRNDETLPGVIHRRLRETGAKVVTAESCTAGLLGAMLTEPPGASASYLGGWIVYDNRLKVEMLGVQPQTLQRHGAVSEETAREMVLGALKRGDAELALSITGVAGPAGPTAEKPVGTVFIALGSVESGEPIVNVRRFLFPGNREMIRQRSAVSALAMLHFHLTLGGALPALLGEVGAGPFHPAAPFESVSPEDASDDPDDDSIPEDWVRLVSRCAHCDCSLRGLPTPRCPECGYDNTVHVINRLNEWPDWLQIVLKCQECGHSLVNQPTPRCPECGHDNSRVGDVV